MYYCYVIVRASQSTHNPLQPGTLSLLPIDILKLLLSTLLHYYNQISPQINGLRTLIMLILNYCMIKFGTQNIYSLFNSFYNNNYA